MSDERAEAIAAKLNRSVAAALDKALAEVSTLRASLAASEAAREKAAEELEIAQYANERIAETGIEWAEKCRVAEAERLTLASYMVEREHADTCQESHRAKCDRCVAFDAMDVQAFGRLAERVVSEEAKNG